MTVKLRTIFLFASAALMNLALSAQYVVQKSNTPNLNNAGNGIYYALPKTVFKIIITYETVNKIKGPFSDYTRQFLGTDNYITQNSSFQRVTDVQVVPVTIPDPEQTYFVQFPPEKQKEPTMEAFTLSPFGTLLAFDDVKTNVMHEQRREEEKISAANSDLLFDKEASYNRKKKVDTVVRKITIDTVTINRFLFKTSWVDRSEEERADDAAKQIAAIREARYNLLTGFQEVNYGESIKYMDGKLNELEHRYLELFLGKTMKSFDSRTYLFNPSPDHKREILFYYVDKEGNRQSVAVEIKPEPLPDKVPQTSVPKINNLYYRIPAFGTVSVGTSEKTFFQEVMPVPQLGVISAAPMDKYILHFDFTTGTITKIKKKMY